MIDLSVITAPVTVPDFSDIKSQEPLMFKAKDIIIQNAEQQASALELLKGIRATIKKAKDKFKSIKDPMNAAKNAVLALEHEIIDPWEESEKIISTANSNYILAEKKRAEAEQREASRKIREEQERLALEEAQRLEDSGESAGAEQVLEKAIARPAPVVVIAPQTAKVAGITSRVNYSAEVSDLKALVEYCLSKPELIEIYLTANSVAINQLARQRKGEFNMPGCKLVEKYV